MDFKYKLYTIKRRLEPEYLPVIQSGSQSVSTSFCQLKEFHSVGHSFN